MFQAPRPISHAPVHSYFTPSVSNANPFKSNHTTNGNSTTSNGEHQHTVAVPLAVTTHRPITITHRGSGSQNSSGPNSATPMRGSLHPSSRAHHTQPQQQQQQQQQPHHHHHHSANGTDKLEITYSPSASPAQTSVSASASPAVFGLNGPSGGGGGTKEIGLGFSLKTPSPPPHPSQSIEPASPMMSPTMSYLQTPTSYPERRDSVDENEAASVHLQGILWRNARETRGSFSSNRHPQTPLSGGSYGMASPRTIVLSSPGVPSTPPAVLARAIPITKRGSTLSILGTLQAHGEESLSREGSRRGSNSGSASQSSLLAGSSPLATSFNSSSFILSQTPPVRAGNPLDRDQCFSPAQQAEYLMHSESGTGTPVMNRGGVLPMMMMNVHTGYKMTGPPGIHSASIQPAHPPLLASKTSTMAQPIQRGRFNKLIAGAAGGPPVHGLHAIPQADEDNFEYHPKLSCTL